MVDRRELKEKAEKYNNMAAHDQPMPDGLELHEQLYYRLLSLLYADFHKGVIGKDEAKHSKAEYTKAYIEQAYKFDLSEEFFKRLKIFQKYQPEIHGSGCPVCEKLNRALCGLETEVSHESEKT